MKQKNLVKGLAIILLACLTTGCGVFQISLKNDSANDSQKTPPASSQPASQTTEPEKDTEDSITPPAENTQTDISSSETADLGELSDDLYSYQIIINGELYEIPMDFSDLTAKGWQYERDENEELDAYTYVPLRTFKNGDYDIEASIINLTDSPQPISACKIIAISITNSYNWKSEISFILPKGIQAHKSTIEDVEKAYGKPTREHGSEDSVFYYYEQSYAEKVIQLTFTKGILEDVEIHNEEY